MSIIQTFQQEEQIKKEFQAINDEWLKTERKNMCCLIQQLNLH